MRRRQFQILEAFGFAGPFDMTTKILLTEQTAMSIRDAAFPLFVTHTEFSHGEKKAERMIVDGKTLQYVAIFLGQSLQYKPVIVSIENKETKILEKFYEIQPHSNGVHWPTPTIERELSFKTFYAEMTRSSHGETTDEPRVIGLDQELE